MSIKKSYVYKVYSEDVDTFLNLIGEIGCSFAMSKETLESSLRDGQRRYRTFELRLNPIEYYRLCLKDGERHLMLKPRV